MLIPIYSSAVYSSAVLLLLKRWKRQVAKARYFFQMIPSLNLNWCCSGKSSISIFSKEERLQIIEKFYTEAVFVQVSSNLTISRDLKDDKFLNLAIDASAFCIITGDKDLLVLHPFRDIPILSPFDFLNSY